MDISNAEGVEEEKPRTVFVGNIPPDTNKRDLEDIFGELGPLKRCHLQYPRKGAKEDAPLVAYVTYALTEDAAAAIENLGNHKIGSNKLHLKLVKSRSDTFRPEPRVDNRAPLKPEKKQRPKKNVKKARLIVRNVSFQATEANLREHFASCGEVKEVNLLRKPSGKLVGCAFIQYKSVYEAIKAMQTLNAKPHLDRTIVVDWAVPKEKYQTKGEDNEVKTEDEEDGEDDSDGGANGHDAGGEDDDDSDTKIEVKPEEDSDDEDEKPNIRPRKESCDADEGKTLFIRNLSFDCTEEELKEFFGRFGDLHYALICKDRLTEHSKGTGFVKFKDVSSAEKCLESYNEDQTEFLLNDRQFHISLAMSKQKLEQKLHSGKQEVKKDNRHLYLAREGFVRPGSTAAEGVSVVDMNKRASLNRTKKQMLKDLNVFVSETRLCVHNLPPDLTDEGFRKIFKKNSDPNAKITEARVMKDLKSLNQVSKEYGFVTFTRHEDAMKALRKINNNPTIFTKNRRPIVEFSLENRKALQAREKRLQKSIEGVKREHPTENDGGDADQPAPKKKRGKASNAETVQMATPVNEEGSQPKKKLRRKKNSEELPEFSGLTGKEGITTLPSFKAKGKITRKSLKPKKKMTRKMREGKTRPKTNRDVTDKLDSMVQNYKSKLSQPVKAGGRKWFE